MTYSDMQRNLESLQSKIRDLQNKIGRKDLLSLDNNSSNGNDNDDEQKPANELRPQMEDKWLHRRAAAPDAGMSSEEEPAAEAKT